MNIPHWKKCEAPICSDERSYKYQPNWKDEVTWHVNEPYCKRRPYMKWQKKQAKMSRLYKKGLFKYPERYWTVSMLNKRYAITKVMKGGSPDRCHTG